MAKRKRLTLPPDVDTTSARAPEAKAMFLDAPTGVVPSSALRKRAAPIADMAGAAAASAALEEVSAEMQAARAEGRLVQNLRTTAIDVGHLMRDRVVIGGEEMDALIASIRARGQQTPIEVLETKPGKYGLISGWRRLSALGRLYEETGDARFAYVQALVRKPASAQDAYVAMVEENEIRVGLSYFERAQIVARTVQAGVYTDSKKALQTLFASASRTKRSKIKSFLPIVEQLGDLLCHPAAMGERMGLELSQRLADERFAAMARDALQDGNDRSLEEEQTALAQLLGDAPKAVSNKGKSTAPASEEVAPGIHLTQRASGISLTGAGVTDDLIDRLRAFLKDA